MKMKTQKEAENLENPKEIKKKPESTKETKKTEAFQKLKTILTRMGFPYIVKDPQHIIRTLSSNKKRNIYGFRGDQMCNYAIHKYCQKRFQYDDESDDKVFFSCLENHLKSNKQFAKYFDYFGLQLLVTDQHCLTQLERQSLHLKGTLFEAFIALLEEDFETHFLEDQFKNHDHNGNFVVDVFTHIMDTFFDFDRYFEYLYHYNNDLPFNESFDYTTVIKELNEKHHNHKHWWSNNEFCECDTRERTIHVHKHPILEIPVDIKCFGNNMSDARNRVSYELLSIFLQVECTLIQNIFRNYILKKNDCGKKTKVNHQDGCV